MGFREGLLRGLKEPKRKKKKKKNLTPSEIAKLKALIGRR